MKPLGLGYQKIDICPNFFMLYYLKNRELIECRICGLACYKLITDRGRTFIAYRKLRYFSITPGLQRLFILPKTVEHMTWNHWYDAVDGVIAHPFDGEG